MVLNPGYVLEATYGAFRNQLPRAPTQRFGFRTPGLGIRHLYVF